MKSLIFYASLMVGVISQFTLANTGQKLSSSETLTAGVTYELNFTLAKTITSGSSLIISFPSQFRIFNTTLGNCMASISSSVIPSSRTCTSVYSSGLDVYSITFSNIYVSGGYQTFLWLKFDITNPWGETSSRIDVYIKDTSATTLDSTTFFISYTAATMTGCSYQGSTGVTGQNTSHILKFTPSRQLIANSYLVITMPFWFIGTTLNISSAGSTTLVCTGLLNTDVSSLPCSLTSSGNSEQLLTINNFVSANKSSPGQLQIQMDSLKNPWSLFPFGAIKFEIYYMSLIITQRCSGIYETATQANAFKGFSFNLTTTEISAVNSALQLILLITNPCPKNRTLLKIEYSSEIGISYSGAGVVVSQNSTQMIFTNLAPSDKTSGSLLLSGFTVTTPPSTRSFTFKFTSLYNATTGTLYDIDTYSKSYQNNPGAITSATATPNDTSINAIASYTVSFKITNKMVSGGFIQIMFPSTLTIDPTSACTVNVFNISSCVVGSNNLTISVNGSISASTSFIVIVNKVKNSAQSVQSSTFKIYSYYDSLYTSLIDKVESGITVTMTANLINTAAVTPSNLTTYTVTSYKFDFTLKDPIYQNGYIEIQFPSTVIPVVGSVSLLSASFSTSTCTWSLSSNILKILNCFLTSPMSTLSTSVTIGGIQNPPSYAPSNTFMIRTYSSVPSLTNYISSGLTVQMTTPYTLTTFTVTPLSSIVHADTKQTVNIVHVIPLTINDYLLISFDSSMTISATLSCSALLGVSSVSCVAINSSQLKVTYTATPSSQTVQYDLSTVMNYDIAQTAITVSTIVYTTGGYVKQTATTTCTYTEAAITTYAVNNDDKIILYDYSQITLTLSTPFTIGSSFDPTKTMLQIILPSGITTAANTTCTVLTGTCTIPLNTKLQINSPGLGLTSFSTIITNILLPYIATQSASFSVTFYYNSKKVSSVSSGVVIMPYCTSPCKACSVTQVKCLSCLPSPNSLIYYNPSNFTCLTVCADGTYPNATNVCQNCVSPCLTCLDALKCLTCVNNTWLSGQSCVNPCPDQFYNGSNGVCLACVSPCNKCKSQLECLSCTTGFYYNYSCLSAVNCPSGTYANTSTLNCEACKSPCLTCSGIESNCTSCITSYFYYNNLCSSTCPNGMYLSVSNCLTCTGLCGNCLNASYCLTCTLNYYYNGQCLTASNCPVGTFADSSQMKCTTCPVGCTSCVSLTNCTSCDTTVYVLYQEQCITSCPAGTYKSANNCLNCASTCATCQNTSTTCLTCPVGTFLINKACLSSCPQGTYQDINQCTSCQIQCSSCTNGNSCSSCSTSYYLTTSGQCLSNCPSGFFQNLITSQCQACTNPCTECESLSSNCTSCSSSFIMYQSQCLSSCPSQYFNVSGTCTTCSNCNNCLSADKCSNCTGGYFLFSGICYLSCPATAPIPDYTSQTCTVCDFNCLKCSGTATNCTSCSSTQYLFNSGCYDTCPSGLVQNTASRTCETKQISSIFYFPTMFSALAVFLILLYSKCVYKETQLVTALAAVMSLFCFVSWVIFFLVLNFIETSLNKQVLTLMTLITLAVIGLSVFLGITYQVYLYFSYDCDAGYTTWLQENSTNWRIHKVIAAGSILTFVFYRFLYGRMFHRVYFSLGYAAGDKLLTHTYRLSLVVIVLQLLPMVAISFYTVYTKQVYDQTVFSALDTLIVNVILIILLLIEGSKSGQEFFQQMKRKIPFLSETKGKYIEVDSSMSIIDIDDHVVQNKKRLKTQIPQKEKDNFFRKITCVDNLNKFGHLNYVTPNQGEHSRSLPETRQFGKHAQFNPLGQDQNQVLDDLFFAEEDEQNYKMQQQRILKEQQHQQTLENQQAEQARKPKKNAWLSNKDILNNGITNQEITNKGITNKGRPQEVEQFHQFEESIQQPEEPQTQEQIKQVELRKQKEQEIRKQRSKREEDERLQRQRLEKMLQDQLEQEDLQCVDIVAIEKAENKNKPKKTPLDLLSKYKTVDEKPIDQKATKKLQEIAKKNGIDPEFMKQTFGVQKHHNEDLLNSIIDKRSQVNRDAVKEMFKQGNNKEVLQQLFSKNSTVDTSKLKQIMNDKNGLNMIEKLMDPQKGLVSPNVAKALFDKNSKYKPEFTKKLLSGETGADETKLQNLLKNAESEKAQEQNLKALKKIGGENLQNTKLIESMLGPKSKLDADQFTKVASSLSTKALQRIFSNKNPENNKIVNKILNNKKLNLKPLAPIFEDDELILELGQKLSGQNPILEENIMNLLKNCGENTDPQKLKEFLQNQVLVKKLMQNSLIDPQFLTEILSKDSKANLGLIEKTIDGMAPEDIKKVFEFTGEKNIDYKSISKIFEQNQKTDPELVKKMLDPELVEEVFTKNNNINSNMLQKLVEKGSKFDKDNIVNIYGKNTDNFLPKNKQNNLQKDGRSTLRNKNPNPTNPNNPNNPSNPNNPNSTIIKNDPSGGTQRNQPNSSIPKNSSVPQMPKDKLFPEINRNQSVPQMLKNRPTSQIAKNQQLSKILPRNSSLRDMIKNDKLSEIMEGLEKGKKVDNQVLQQMIGNGSLQQMIKIASNGQPIKIGDSGETINFESNGQITKTGSKGQSIKVDPNGQTTITKPNGQKIKIAKNGQITIMGRNGQILRQGSYTQIAEEETFKQLINNGSFGQITQMLQNGTFQQMIENGKLGQVIKNQTLQQMAQNGSLSEVIKNVPFSQILKKAQNEDLFKERVGQMKNGTIYYDAENNQTEYDFKMTFNKTANDNFNLSENGQVRPQQVDEMIMSRTDGGMMGFLNPLKLKQNKSKLKGSKKIKDEWDDLSEKLQDLDQDEEQEEVYQKDQAILEQEDEEGLPETRKRKAPMKKKKFKKITDIRHPAEKIYLEPILAPHQRSKSFRKKKKINQSQSGSKLVMDEDNDVFDIDF